MKLFKEKIDETSYKKLPTKDFFRSLIILDHPTKLAL
jgi:hypothetical protein